MTKTLSRRCVLKAGVAAGAVSTVAGLGLSTPALAQGRRVTVIDGYPDRSMWLQVLSNFYLPEVNRELEAAGAEPMNFQESYGGSIVRPRGVLEGMRLGLGDIGVVTTIFHNSSLPSQALSAVTPFISSDPLLVARSIDEIANEFPSMREEFEAQNQVYLATGVVLDSYQMFSRTPIAHVEDMQSMRVAGAGYNLRYLEGIDGAVGVRGGLTDFYNMIQTNVVDAAMLWPEAANTFGIVEVAPHMLRADLGAVNSKTLTANLDFWNTLSEAEQTALRTAAIQYRDEMANEAARRAGDAEAAYVAAGGTIVDLPAEERELWAAQMPNISAEWVATLNEAERDGSAMLSAYIQKLRDGGATPVRDWSAES